MQRFNTVICPRYSMFGHITLPCLKILSFCGATEYLEEFIARIDLPALWEITKAL